MMYHALRPSHGLFLHVGSSHSIKALRNRVFRNHPYRQTFLNAMKVPTNQFSDRWLVAGKPICPIILLISVPNAPKNVNDPAISQNTTNPHPTLEMLG